MIEYAFGILTIPAIIIILYPIMSVYRVLWKLFNQDKLINNNLSLQPIKIFYKFYYVNSKNKGKIFLYIRKNTERLEDGKKIFERFFIFGGE